MVPCGRNVQCDCLCSSLDLRIFNEIRRDKTHDCRLFEVTHFWEETKHDEMMMRGMKSTSSLSALFNLFVLPSHISHIPLSNPPIQNYLFLLRHWHALAPSFICTSVVLFVFPCQLSSLLPSLFLSWTRIHRKIIFRNPIWPFASVRFDSHRIWYCSHRLSESREKNLLVALLVGQVS